MTGGARGLIAAADKIEAKIVEAEKLRAALEEIKRLHAPLMMPVNDELWRVCDHCCFEDDGHLTEDCAQSHEHTADGPGCATAEVIARAGL